MKARDDMLKVDYILTWDNICDILNITLEHRMQVIEMYGGQSIYIDDALKIRQELREKKLIKEIRKYVQKGYNETSILAKLNLCSKEYKKLLKKSQTYDPGY